MMEQHLPGWRSWGTSSPRLGTPSGTPSVAASPSTPRCGGAGGDTGDTEPHSSPPHPRLRKGVRVVAHMLRLTGRLAQTLDDTSRRLHAELSRRLQSSAAHAAAAAAAEP